MSALPGVPEMMLWWASIPFLVLGLWFTIRHRLREVAPIIIFLTLLTISYSIIQGNVGTAYRQRAQLLIFYFIFVAVGYALYRQKREQKVHRAVAAQRAQTEAIRRLGKPAEADEVSVKPRQPPLAPGRA